MNALVINNTEYKAPDKLTVKQWMEMSKWDTTIPTHFKHVLGIAMSVPEEYVELIPDELAGVGMTLISGLLNPLGKPYKRELNESELIDFKSMPLSKFIDLEVYIDQGFDKALDRMVNTLYDTDDSSDWDVSDVFGAVFAFLSYRSTIYKSYKHLFTSDEVSEEKTKPQIAKVWYDIVMVLADGKFLEIDKVLERTVIECFNWLAWNKDKQRREHNAIKNITR